MEMLREQYEKEVVRRMIYEKKDNCRKLEDEHDAF